MYRVLLLIALVTFAAVSVAQPPADDRGSFATTWSFSSAKPIKAKKVDGPGTVLAFGVIDADAAATCRFEARDRGSARKGVRGKLTARTIDIETGAVLQEFAPNRFRTKRSGKASVTYKVDGNGQAFFPVALIVEVDLSGGKRITGVALACGFDSIPLPGS